jgi:hypothetical protein
LNLDKEKKRRKPLFWALGTKFGPSQLFCASPIPSPLSVRPYPASGPDGQLLRALLCRTHVFRLYDKQTRLFVIAAPVLAYMWVPPGSRTALGWHGLNR